MLDEHRRTPGHPQTTWHFGGRIEMGLSGGKLRCSSALKQAVTAGFSATESAELF
jgi:hypothetical protein